MADRYWRGGGDALRISNCNFPAEALAEQAIRLAEKGGAVITDVINGSIYLDRCSPVLIENWHNESGRLTIKGSNDSR